MVGSTISRHLGLDKKETASGTLACIHCFVLTDWMSCDQLLRTPASVASLLPWTPTWSCGPRKSFLPELLLTGHFIFAAEKKTKTAFLPLPRFSSTLSSAAAKQNSVTTDKKPSGNLPQSSRHRPSTVFLYVAAPCRLLLCLFLSHWCFTCSGWLWACPLTPGKHCTHSLCLPGHLNYFFTSCKYPPIPVSL